jgi:hypothetical protein
MADFLAGISTGHLPIADVPASVLPRPYFLPASGHFPLDAGAGMPARWHGYASSALAFVFALCMKYNRPSIGMNSKWQRLAAAAKAARFALPTSSISPNAYAVSIGEKRAFASCMVIQPGSSMGSHSRR